MCEREEDGEAKNKTKEKATKDPGPIALPLFTTKHPQMLN